VARIEIETLNLFQGKVSERGLLCFGISDENDMKKKNMGCHRYNEFVINKLFLIFVQ